MITRGKQGMPKVYASGLLVYDHVLFLDSYPALNEKRVTSDFHRFFGGPASNALAFLSRSGVETALLAAGGDDGAGRRWLMKSANEVSGRILFRPKKS